MATYTYNAFGLVWGDIVKAFNGAVADDFATANDCGQKIIEDEISLKEGELIGFLSEGALDYFRQIPTHEVTTTNLSGATSFGFDFTPDFGKKIRVEVSSDCSDNTSLLDCNTRRCTGGEEVTYYQDSDGIWRGLLDRIIRDDERVVITYSPDIGALNLPSLKSILRDAVACSLGMNLYSDSDSTWAHVERYCTRADKMYDKLDGWIPPEFKRLKYLEWNGPFRGVRGNRL